MKKFAYLFLAVLVVPFFTSCGPKKPEKSIESLKAAYNGESTASAKYAKFAEKAREEGFDTLAVMFDATSKAEAVHAGNHKKALEKLGDSVSAPVIGEFVVMSTAENLADAIKGETYEIDSMYPGFIAIAEAEQAVDAKKSFTWALDTEKKHKMFYQKALEAVNANNEKTLTTSWSVCPVCGNTYESATLPEACDFCMTKKDQFITFQFVAPIVMEEVAK